LIILTNTPQGSPAWHAVRLQHFCASEASQMLGVSKYGTRTALLQLKKTGVSPEVDAATQRRFDAGHESEAAAIEIAEDIIGEVLFPVVATAEIEGMPMLASFDGLTFDHSIVWENKLWNQKLVAAVESGELEPHYWVQLEHQLLVSQAEKALFTVSDGTEENTRSLWYESVPERRAKLIAGWRQFAIDLAAYIPTEAAAPVVAAPQLGLPAVSIVVNGSIALVDNLDKFGQALKAYVERINKKPETDEDFATLEATVKTLKTAEEALDAAESGALAQTDSIDTMRKTVALYRETARSNRLLIEKLVKSEKESRRTAIISEAAAELHTHIRKCNDRIGKPYMPSIPGDFAGVVKGLKSLDSMKDKVSTELARCKISANEWADQIQLNLGTDGLEEYSGLFADIATLCLKAPEDFKNTVTTRITAHKAKEAARLEAEREKIRAEEQAKAQREAARQHEQERQFAAQEAARQQEQERQFAAQEAARQQEQERQFAAQEAAEITRLEKANTTLIVEVAPAVVPVANVIPMTRPASTPPTLKLGDIADRLGFNLTADFLQSLGFTATTDRNAKLYQEADFPLICAALVNHIQHVQAQQAA